MPRLRGRRKVIDYPYTGPDVLVKDVRHGNANRHLGAILTAENINAYFRERGTIVISHYLPAVAEGDETGGKAWYVGKEVK